MTEKNRAHEGMFAREVVGIFAAAFPKLCLQFGRAFFSKKAK